MSGSGDPSDGRYFIEFRKGEVNELRTALRQTQSAATADKQKENVQKVIAYMTLGIDVSSLFSEMIMATNTTDLVQKKLVYMYLCTYAETHPELSVLAINTLHKDCRDRSPMVRGLALRALSSLRVPSLVEYLLPQLQGGLLDTNPYVRKTSVTCCVKLFRLSPSHVRGSELIDKLYDMLRDRDPQVVSNVVCALNEILAEEGGMAINRSIAIHLLNKLVDFNEWSQCYILELVAKYQPPREEVFDYLNLLESRLQHANGAVVFAAIKVFLSMTEDFVDLYQKVLKRIKVPLLTRMLTGTLEMKYTALHHIKLVLTRAPRIFDTDFKSFFCSYNDPPYIKQVKVDILELIASKVNMHDVVAELSEYVRDVDMDLAKRSVRAIAKVCINVPQVAEHSFERLLSFLELEVDYLTSETLAVMTDVLRCYPEHHTLILPDLPRWASELDQPVAKSAVVWMLGEYGEEVEAAPYLLETMVNTFQAQGAPVRLQLLTALMKLFFKRPGEVQPILGRALDKGSVDSNIDVHDRSYLYYRLLQEGGPEATQQIVCSRKEGIKAFAEDTEYQVTDKIWNEFNTLSVIYNRPSERFLKTDAELEEEKEREESTTEESSEEWEEEEEEEWDSEEWSEEGEWSSEGYDEEPAAAASGGQAASSGSIGELISF